MASSVAGHRRAFGEDVVPGCYEDFELADLVVLVGSNLAWCHPVLYRRLMDAREKRGTRIVVIDPRRTASCEGADLHLAIEPGTDVLLFNALLCYVAAAGAADTTFLTNATSGFEAALDAARCEASDLARVAAACGVSPRDLETFLSWFAATHRTVTVYSQGVNQSSHGTDKVNAIINCHLATGRIGKPGCGPFSITGQPNAMGGREVGGLANQLAAHMTFESAADVERVSRFWRAPGIARAPGLKAVDMFEAVGEGKIRAIWIMGTNPAVSLPNSSRVRAALADCEFVVVSECVEKTDTTAFAHVLLPAQSWGEKDGTVTNSDRTISRQRAFRRATGEARADWWAICGLAKRMGFSDAFNFAGPAQIFREHACLSAFENSGERVFNLAGLARLDDEGYADLEPVQWPLLERTAEATKRLFSDGRFATPSGRARFVAVRFEKPA
jgi:assimilatory nitrate reductase catalytic subunit